MRLPKRLWRILRSKRFRRFLIILPFLIAIALTAFYAGVNAWGRKKLEARIESLRELGIPVTSEELAERAEPGPGQTSLLDLPELSSLSAKDTDINVLFPSIGLDGGPPWLTPDRSSKGIARHFPKSRRSEPEDALARELLTRLEPASTKLEPLLRALGDPQYIHPTYIEGDSSLEPFERINEAMIFIVKRAYIRVLAGHTDQALDDLELLSSSLARWQDRPGGQLEAVMRLGIIPNVSSVARYMMRNIPLSTRQLERLAEAFEQIDDPRSFIHSYEFDVWLYLDALATDHTAATTLPFSRMRWVIDWSQDWDGWRETMSDFWWQVRPVGFHRADYARVVGYTSERLVRGPGGQLRDAISIDRMERAREFIDEHRLLPGAGMSVSLLQGGLRTFLQLRMTRLALACHQYHIAHGEFPESADQLTPNQLFEPLRNPFSNETLKIQPAEDGSLQPLPGAGDLHDPLTISPPPAAAESANSSSGNSR